MLKSKIHRATVTQANLHYVGSLTISSDLMRAADLLPGEKVDVVDVTNGARLSTYVIEGPKASGVIGVNGAAAHLIKPGDIVIIIAYALMHDSEIAMNPPKIVFVDEDNRACSLGTDPVAPVPGTVRGDLISQPGAPTKHEEATTRP
jgi:aspartate 1-decarboxylase